MLLVVTYTIGHMPPNRTSSPPGHGGSGPEKRADGRSERWREHRESRRRSLVGAVVAAVSAQGADIGMDDIAQQSGVSKQVFYRYFADKADLRLAVGRSVARWLVRDITRAVEAEVDLHAMLAAGIDRYLTVIETNREVYRFVVSPTATGSRHRGQASDLVADFETVLGLQVARLIGDRQRAAGLDAGAAETWGFALVGAVRAAADRWLAAPSLSRGALGDYLTEFAWNGLSSVDRADTTGDSAQVQSLADAQRRRGRR
jgi:AcrR family transcriptional regulator